MYQKTYINFVNISSVEGDELMEQTEFLSNIFGYNQIKNELYKVYTWFLDALNDESLKTLLPKGILFYGEPGLGKTFLAKEFASSLQADVFIVDGEQDNIEKEIIEVYAKANGELELFLFYCEKTKKDRIPTKKEFCHVTNNIRSRI